MQTPTTSDFVSVSRDAGRVQALPLSHLNSNSEQNDPTSPEENSAPNAARKAVTLRAFLLGLVLSSGVAALNCWIETVANVHFVGGVQMPFGVIFAMVFLVVGVNWPLRALTRRVPLLGRVCPPLSSVELTTIYAMMLFGALVSTPGADNLFLTVGPALFYYGTRENGWADAFYGHVPSWFAPGWDGKTYQQQVIDPLYIGGLSFSEVPWHAWLVMVTAWSGFLLLIYSLLFFTSLLLRRQWIEHEALAFPLVQLPLQMVEATGREGAPPGRAFWANQTMWAGFAFAAFFHMLRGLNNFYPDWPVISSFQGNNEVLALTEKPWNSVGYFPLEIYFGAIGIAYLLTSELALSFWAFFLLTRVELVVADLLGFPAGMLPQGPYVPFGGKAQPTFIAFQGMGGWAMLGILLLWPARRYFWQVVREAWGANRLSEGEPFAPRVVLGGLVFSAVGLLAWCSFSGINLIFALIFFGIYTLASVVLARLVVEGGYLFPETSFMPLEWMTTGMMSAATLGTDNLVRLSFLQASVMTDTRTNTLPAFLHTLKLAHAQGLDVKSLRRLLYCVGVSLVFSLGVTIVVSIATLYSKGALASYSFSATLGPQRVFTGAASVIAKQPSSEMNNFIWMAVGALVVLGVTIARSRFAWFPLHPLGYIAAPSYGPNKLWLSFFLGWLIKTMLMKYGGSAAYMRARPFMMGLILGNATAMVFWMIFGLFKGSQIPYWPA